MAEFIGAFLVIGFVLGCFIGALMSLAKCVRAFMSKQVWKGSKALFIGIVLSGILFLIFPSSGRWHGGLSARIVCSNNVKSLVLFMKMCAMDNNGNYPASFNTLIGDYIKKDNLDIFSCAPADKKMRDSKDIHIWSSYVYVSGLTEKDPTNCVEMFCLPENHKNLGANVGFLDGRVMWFPCVKDPASTEKHPIYSFQELTNTPSLFYGTTNEVELADLMSRTKIIYPKHRK